MNQKILYFVSLYLFLFSQSCAQTNLSFDNSDEIQFAKEFLKIVKNGNTESFKSSLQKDVLDQTRDDQIELLIKQGQDLFEAADIPPDSLIEEANKINFLFGKKYEIALLSFPFSLESNNDKDSIIYFNIAVSENKILSLNIHEFPFTRKLEIVPAYKDPHLEHHTLSYDHISWFRIWYGSGFIKNDFGDSYGYYAVEGKKKKLDKLKIQKELSQLFDLINQATIDSTDFKFMRDEKIGEPEYIYLRFKLDNKPYDQFGEFSIYYHLAEEPDKPEPLSKYIILKHSDQTRYLLLKENNQAIVELLKEISYRKYDKYFEKRWH